MLQGFYQGRLVTNRPLENRPTFGHNVDDLERIKKSRDTEN